MYYASPDEGCEFIYISDLTEEQIKYINENLKLEVENNVEPDFINFNYSCNCSTNIDLRDYLENEGLKEIEDSHYTDGFIEFLRSWNQEPLKRPLNFSITK